MKIFRFRPDNRRRTIGDGTIGDGTIGDGTIGDGTIGDGKIGDEKISGEKSATKNRRRKIGDEKSATKNRRRKIGDGKIGDKKTATGKSDENVAFFFVDLNGIAISIKMNCSATFPQFRVRPSSQTHFRRVGTILNFN